MPRRSQYDEDDFDYEEEYEEMKNTRRSRGERSTPKKEYWEREFIPEDDR